MAVITNYATLQTAVSDYLARDDLTGFLPNFIQNAESKIYRKYNIRDMEQVFSGTTSSGILAVPSRYNKMKHARVAISPSVPLIRKSAEWIYENYPIRSGGNTPKYYDIDNDQIIFGPFPSDIAIAGTYYQYYEPLRATDPNWYVTNRPDILLYASLLEAEPFIKNDERLVTWKLALDDAIQGLLDSEEVESDSGSVPYVTTA